ncbi:MAG: phosphoserine phosphatase SerB [Bifidobacteriaceae bacterium]|nr:phosphoserine phosphatase SerB [Bifidobacteriaceae bacterium]
MTNESLQALNTPTLSKHGLFVMDVDSTLIDEEVIDELGVVAQVGDRIADITARAMAGELDFKQALATRVQLLQGLPESVFDKVYERIHFTNGMIELINTLHEHDWKVGVVSGGFHEIVDRLAAEAHIDYTLANRLEVNNGVLTGKTLGEIITSDVKLRTLHQWAQELHIPLSQTAAMGDGANDIPMILEAGLGIAFCAKPKTQAAAPHVLNTRDARLVLDFFN